MFFTWAIIFGIIAICLGVRDKREMKLAGKPTGIPTAGIICGAIGLVLFSLTVLFMIIIIMTLGFY